MVKGELVYTYHVDLGGEVRMAQAAKLAAGQSTVRRAETAKNAPVYVEFGRPLIYNYPPQTLHTDHGPRTAAAQARVYAIGAVSVSLRIPIDEPTLADVNALTHMRLADGTPIDTIAHRLAHELRTTILPALVETYTVDVEPENYLAIVLTDPGTPASELLETHRQTLAGIVTGEPHPQRLAPEEIEDNLSVWYRYYNDDLAIIDWERTLIIEPTGRVDDVLTVIEVANLELLELRAYDRYLDDVLERAYEDLSRFYGRSGLFRSAREVQSELSDARIDLVRVTDSINNIGKIFGDYYLAKIHMGLTERFHLREWETIVREKMATLNELYTLASHEVEHRRGMLLEGTIVLLFIIDLILIYLVSK